MARGSTRRSYVRDGRGRFASTGTTGRKAKPAARRAQRGTNRLTRDNSGKITGVGKNGATARGGRLRTAAGNQRGAVLDRLKRAPMAGTVSRRGKVRGGVKVAKPQRSAKLSASQRAVAQRARDTFNDPTLLLNGRIAKGYKETIQAIQQKFGVNNRIATLAFMRRAFRMGTSDIQYIDTARTKKTIRALRATTAVGSLIGGSSRRAKGAAIPSTVSRGRRKAAAASAPVGAKARATVNGANQAKARLQRAKDNYDRKKYAVFQAEARLKKAKSPKARKELDKANKSLMTASQAVSYLNGNMDSGALRRGSRYRAGNRGNVASTYSVKRVAGAFRPGKSRLVAPPKGTRMGRAIPGSGGQIKATAKAARPSGTIRKPEGLKPGALAQRTGAKGGKGPSGTKAIPRGELKRYRMLENKIDPLRKSLDRDGSTMVGSTDREAASRASARYSQNLRKLRRITDTMRRLSNSPETPNIPRLPMVASTGARLGRTAAIKRMDGPRKFGGQSWRDLRGQYADGRVQYEDNYMNKSYNRKYKGSTIKGPKLGGVVRPVVAKPKATPKPSGTISRSRSQAKAAQRRRRDSILARTRGTIGRRGRNSRENPRIRAVDTGMRQLSLMGKPKKLKRYRPVK